MTDDPDELLYDQEVARRDPATAIAAIQEIEVQLRHGIRDLISFGWAIVVLLALILWRIW